jgi:hypothetical protein
MFLSDVLVADVSEAEAICDARGSHFSQWPCIQAKGLENTFFAALWKALTDGACGESLFRCDEEHVLHSVDGGEMLVIHLPDDLRNRIASINTGEISEVAARWAEDEELQSENVDAESANQYLAELVDLARRAVQENKSLLLWICC